MRLKNFKSAIFLAAMVCGFAGGAFACGPFFPNNLLDAGDHAVLQAPVADFQRELERMKCVKPTTHAVPPAAGQSFPDQSAEVEMTDLAAALRRKNISSEPATAILQAHLAERMKLNAFLAAQYEWSHFHSRVYDTNWNELPDTNPPPVFPAVAVTPGLPREFALYFQGAIAWQQPAGGRPCESWERLLELPPSERHFKSTWAAFMLAKYYGSQTNAFADDEALKYYGQVRALAKNGFADSAGLAAAAIGEEARICLRRKNYERAIGLYLEQFAAGDRSAVNSLRFAAARAVAGGDAAGRPLKTLALNPLARRVITAYLISREPGYDCEENQSAARLASDRATAWLEAIEAARLKEVESASQLALAAYQAGDMETAQRWIKRAGREPVAQWLQAKLFMRAGNISSAAELLAALCRRFPQDFSATNRSASFADNLSISIRSYEPSLIAIGRQAWGELGVLRLARREYAESLDALLRSGYWMDAAYVAERVLTADELKTYVDRQWPAAAPATVAAENVGRPDDGWKPANLRLQIRDLLARRLARLGRDAEARRYFSADTRPKFDALMSALQAAGNQDLPDKQRAGAFFAAGLMTRTNGLELFGTEVEPDWAALGGMYDWGVSVASRTNELFKLLAGTADELDRARRHAPDPAARFHYRYQAADLAWAAARLLPDDSDETARVLCTGGSWIKYLDPERADRFYKSLVRRCRKSRDTQTS